MRLNRALVCGMAILFIATCVGAHGEDAPPARCFRMAMVDDGKPADAPAYITFADGSEREEVKAHDNQFCVPESMMNAQTLDLTFEASGSRFNLFNVRLDLFDAEWDVAFGGKRYAREEKIAKTINAEESCTVHIHQGEAEKSMTIVACRLAVKQSR